MWVQLRGAAMTLEDLRAPIEEEKRLDRVLDRLTESARKTIPAAMAASVSLLVDEDQTAWTPTATDETAVAIDKLVPHADRARPEDGAHPQYRTFRRR
jgi:hypothetical protein